MTNHANPCLSDYPGHILEAIERIDRYTADPDRVEFESTGQIQDAVIRNFEVLGEAARNIERRYPEFVREHANVPWVSAYEMHNALAHGYFKVDLGVVWDTIQTDLPGFAKRVKELRDGLSRAHE